MTKRHSEVLREEYAEYKERIKKATVRNLGGLAASGLWAVGSEAVTGSWDLSAISILTGGFFALRMQRDWMGSESRKNTIKTQEHIEKYKDALPKFELNYKLRTTISMMHQDAERHEHDAGGCNTHQSRMLAALERALNDSSSNLRGVLRPVAYMLDTNRHQIVDVRDPDAKEANIVAMGGLLDTYMPTTPEHDGQGLAVDSWTDYLRQYSTDDVLADNVNKLWSQTP